ncbi:MAG: hypothetical protein ABIO37_03560 [Caulobacteraceae bacterium]
MLGAFRLLVGGVVAFVCATALFWAGLLFEHRPAGWPDLKLGVFHLRLPDGPWARLAAVQRVAAAAEAHNKQLTLQRAEVSRDASVAEAKAQGRIRIVYRTLREEIPTYVTPETDRRFALPVGLVRLHDAAARGVALSRVPDPAGEPDGAASSVQPSDLAAAITDNYGACRADSEQLAALQAWIGRQQGIE